MATRTWRGTTDTAWNTAANWLEEAVPTSADDVVFDDSASTYTLNIVTTGASVKSFTTTGTTNAVTVTTTGVYFTVAGSFITKSGDNITTAYLFITSAGTLTQNGATWTISQAIRYSGTGTLLLGSAISIAGDFDLRAGILDTSGSSYALNTNYLFRDNNSVTVKGLILNSSVITCTGVLFTGGTLTVTGTDHTINIAHVAHIHDNFGGASWGTVNYNMTPTVNDVIYNIDGAGAATFVSFHAHLLAAKTGTIIQFAQDNTFLAFEASGNSGTNTLTLTVFAAGTHLTLTDTAGTNTLTNCVITELNAAGGATWNALIVDGNTITDDSTGWTTGVGGVIGSRFMGSNIFPTVQMFKGGNL